MKIVAKEILFAVIVMLLAGALTVWVGWDQGPPPNSGPEKDPSGAPTNVFDPVTFACLAIVFATLGNWILPKKREQRQATRNPDDQPISP